MSILTIISMKQGASITSLHTRPPLFEDYATFDCSNKESSDLCMHRRLEVFRRRECTILVFIFDHLKSAAWSIEISDCDSL